MKIKVAIFEDNTKLCIALSAFINGTPDFECVGTFPNCVNIIKDVERTEPDVVLMDIRMPYISGIEGVKMIKDRFPHIKVLMQTVVEDDEKIFQSIYAGASGYILKNSSSDRILDFIMELYTGGAPMSPSIATRVLKMVQPPSPEIKRNSFNLTEREKEVLACLVNGMSYKLIADYCQIRVDTVNKHMQSIYEKLHVHSKSQAVAKAIKGKIV